MSAVKSGLRAIVLTPERIPSFLIPSRGSFLASPRLHRGSSDRTRLLSDTDSTDTSPPVSPGQVASPRGLLRLPAPPRMGRLRRAAAAAEEADDAAMSLQHVPKVTTPYGFRGLAASPCTSRRESLFHRCKPVKLTVTDAQEDPEGTPHVPSAPGGSRVSYRPVRALGQQMLKELKKPAAALRALSPSHRATSPR
ncbi:C2 calcium-dependent domain-containing protein 4C [Austrofundulus limnaeus]|uniref:C2 calcium-dependent domain-containing protein 4C-like n=1 Tax=Austrofundulus limnaeus TaxID=52670 RepID=A0A2I4CD33_AUSLI|nr:PREDICTED: C2 calcium-dependent domain-containing protein 4C-like [Austrofundulus limnaeus]XP_013877900.1 PREDICTED: C2 calcium-dependent domain-containing protein 4C-like [Austrofundulus limnaeus]